MKLQSISSQTLTNRSIRINTRKEGVDHCLYPFESTIQDLVWPIRLKHAPYFMLATYYFNRMWARACTHVRIRSPAYISLSHVVNVTFQMLCNRGSKRVQSVGQTLPPSVYPARTKHCGVWGSGFVRLVDVVPRTVNTHQLTATSESGSMLLYFLPFLYFDTRPSRFSVCNIKLGEA